MNYMYPFNMKIMVYLAPFLIPLLSVFIGISVSIIFLLGIPWLSYYYRQYEHSVRESSKYQSSYIRKNISKLDFTDYELSCIMNICNRKINFIEKNGYVMNDLEKINLVLNHLIIVTGISPLENELKKLFSYGQFGINNANSGVGYAANSMTQAAYQIAYQSSNTGNNKK